MRPAWSWLDPAPAWPSPLISWSRLFLLWSETAAECFSCGPNVDSWVEVELIAPGPVTDSTVGVLGDLELEAVKAPEQRRRRDRAVVGDDDQVVRSRPARAHHARDLLERDPRRGVRRKLGHVGRAGVQRERRHCERRQQRGCGEARIHRVPGHPVAAVEQRRPGARQRGRRGEAVRVDPPAEQHERRRHHHDRAAGGERGAGQHPGPERDHQLGRPDDRHDREREDERGSADQDGPAGRPQFGGRGGHRIARLRARRKLLAVEAVEDQQREPHTESKARHRAEGDADGIERDHVAEQRDLTEARRRADRAHAGHEQRRHGRAQPDQQEQEQDPDRDQLGAAQVRDRRVLERAIDRRLPGDVRPGRR